MFNPSHHRILAIGKVRKRWIQHGIALYLKRLPGLTINELRDSTPEKETKEILSSLKKNESLVVLGEEFQSITSLEFANHLNQFESRHLVFVIGGSEGISPEVKKISPWKLSLSSLTFPHDIARLLLIEQIYRAQTILKGNPYHRH